MTHLEMKWPDEKVEQVRAAKGRIECAGDALRTMSIDDRLRVVASVLEDWTSADSAWRRELVTTFSEHSPFHEKTVREGFDAALRAWNPNALIECAIRELTPIRESPGLELSPFQWTAYFAGGGIPMPTLLGPLLPLILGSPVLVRETSSDPVTARLLERSLEARSEIFARCFERISVASDDVAIEELLTAPCVVATGSDSTIQSISTRLRPGQRFVAHGHKFSIGVLGPTLQGDADALQQAMEAFALDIARWDQTGCLSPVVVYLIELDDSAREKIASSLANALDSLHARMPRGELSIAVAASHASEIAEARMRQSSNRAVLFEGRDSTVVLEDTATTRPAPLHRFIRLMPVASIEDLNRTLSPFVGHLSTVACAGFSEIESTLLHGCLSRLGVSRITTPGRLQIPPIDWPHDGMPLFTPLAHLTQSS